MSGSVLVSTGLKAMTASYAGLQTTSHNIANASVEGYSRQRVELETSRSKYTGSGFFGLGVDVSAITRSHDDFLTREAATAQSVAAMDKAHAEQLNRLEPVFPTGEASLGQAALQFLNAMVDVAARPQDLSAREVVLARAREVADRFSSSANQLDTLQRGVTQDLKNSIGTVNSLAQRVAQVNGEIAAAVGSGQDPNDLLDHRDQLIRELSQLVQVSTVAAKDGTLGVFIAGGQKLVLGEEASRLSVVPDPVDITRSAVAIEEGAGVRVLPPSLMAGGSVAGLLKFQSQDLTQAGNFLGQMARALADRVNQQQALGIDLRGGAGQPLFEVGAPRALPMPGNQAGTSLPTLSVTNAAALQASDYELSVDPSTPGQYTLTRLRDGVSQSVSDGAVVDGFQIQLGAVPPTAGDRFILQPVARGAVGMKVNISRPEGIAAAQPVSPALAPGNTGTAGIASLTMTQPPGATVPTTTFTFGGAAASPAGAINLTISDGVNPPVTTTWVPGAALEVNGFSLRLSGVPASGDVVTVAPTRYTSSNNGNALVLASLRDEAFIDGNTITDAYASAMGNIGVRVQSANTASAISSQVATTSENRRAAQSGVNLDEEAAHLIHQQQQYQAAAKVLQVAQSVFDTLLQVAAA